MAFLVDTSVWVDWLRDKHTPETGWLKTAIIRDVDMIVPGLVVTEVLRGMATERHAQRMEYLLDQFPPAPALEDLDYRDAARLYRFCRGRGVTIPSTIDCLIAQLAIRHKLFLVTCDRDFQAIARITPLVLARLPAN